MIYYDFVEKRFFHFFVNIKISYYWFNRQELLQKAKETYDNGGKEKAAKYYRDNKDAIKEKANCNIKICQKKRKKQKENIPRIDTTK